MLTADQRDTFDRKLAAARSRNEDAAGREDLQGVNDYLLDLLELLADAQGSAADIDDAFASLRLRAQRGL